LTAGRIIRRWNQPQLRGETFSFIRSGAQRGMRSAEDSTLMSASE